MLFVKKIHFNKDTFDFKNFTQINSYYNIKKVFLLYTHNFYCFLFVVNILKIQVSVK